MPEGPTCEAVEWLLRREADESASDDQAVLDQMLFHYANERGIIGVLANVFHNQDERFREIEDLDENESTTLQWALSALRTEGWFAEWLKIQLCNIACNPNEPDSRFPTPLQVASTLTEFIKEHEDRLEAARNIARQRPDLLFPAPQATPEPAAAPEPPEPAPKPQSVRKPRKKARPMQ